MVYYRDWFNTKPDDQCGYAIKIYLQQVSWNLLRRRTMIKLFIRLLFYTTLIVFEMWWLLAIMIVLDIATFIVKVISATRGKY